MSAYHACEKIGMPECDTILAHVATYLAETKKSVRTYKAYNKVIRWKERITGLGNLQDVTGQGGHSTATQLPRANAYPQCSNKIDEGKG